MTERTVRQIIEGQLLVTVPVNTSVMDAARLMKQHNIGALMVVEDETLVGIFTERDGSFRVLATGLDPAATRLSEVMTRHPQTIDARSDFTVALQMMHDGGFRHLPVLDDGRLVGVVSVRDALGPELEAFVYEMLRRDQVHQLLA